MREIDTIIRCQWVIPIEPQGAVLNHHAVAIDQGKIVELAPIDAITHRYQARETVELDHHVLMPGLVNAHSHGPMALMRGVADDIPLEPWLSEHIWPLENRWVGPDFVRDGTTLAAAEMLKGGVTCVQEMYFFPDVIARTLADIGIRCGVGAAILDFPTPSGDGPKDYIAKALALRDEYKGHPLVTVMLAPHATYTVSPPVLSQIGVLSDQLDVGVHIHLQETAQEVADVVKAHGKRPVALLQEVGLLSPSLTGVHMTQATEEEIDLLAKSGCRIVHCPESNLKLASGFCPVKRYMDAGIPLGLGTDGAASNNNLSMLGEIQTAALLAKGVSGDATALNAHEALHMATLGSARTMGLEDQIGSLVAGKWADLTAIDLNHISVQPVFDPASQVVYVANDEQVTDVWVAGRTKVKNGSLVSLDSDALIEMAKSWQQRMVTK